jgi:hypothetical protein
LCDVATAGSDKHNKGEARGTLCGNPPTRRERPKGAISAQRFSISDVADNLIFILSNFIGNMGERLQGVEPDTLC